jgi:DNA-binding transcriptional LysR family regulator
MALNLHLLRLFATVARAGSFSKAAEILLLSQPSISKGVRDFELQLGCRLLDRTPRGVKPTREGLALMRHAETLFAAERDAEEELRALRSLDSGSLRIGASTTIASYFIPEYLGRFHAAYPGIDLQLTSANTRDIAHLMLAHEIEIGLVEGPVEEDGLVSEPWRTDVMELIAQALGARKIDPARTLEIGSTEAIKQVVAAGLGVAIVSVAAMQDQIALKRLLAIKMRGLRIERTLWKLKTPGRLDVPAATAFERLISRPAAPNERRSASAQASKAVN